MALLEQPEARGLLISDERVREEWILQPYVEGVQPPRHVRHRLPARRPRRDRREHRRARARAAGVGLRRREGEGGAARLQPAVRRAARSDPPRRYDATPIDRPPFYVIETVPAISFTFDGLAIDDHARVLGEDGEPIPGLLRRGGRHRRGLHEGLRRRAGDGSRLRAARVPHGDRAAGAGGPRLMDALGGRTAVVTGAASGIGLALAERFAAEGMKVVMSDVDPERLDEAASRVGGWGRSSPSPPTWQCGMTSSASPQQAAAVFGPVHLLCNNAGVQSSGTVWEYRAARVAVAPRRQPVGRDPRDQGVCPGDDRARQPGARRQHVLGRRARHLPRHGALRSLEVGGDRNLREPPSRPSRA